MVSKKQKKTEQIMVSVAYASIIYSVFGWYFLFSCFFIRSNLHGSFFLHECAVHFEATRTRRTQKGTATDANKAYTFKFRHYLEKQRHFPPCFQLFALVFETLNAFKPSCTNFIRFALAPFFDSYRWCDACVFFSSFFAHIILSNSIHSVSSISHHLFIRQSTHNS